MSQQAATQRTRRQTAPSGIPLELKAKQTEKLDTIPDDTDSIADIQNELEFNEWYQDLEATLLESSCDEYQACLDELQISKSHLDTLLSDTSSTLSLLSKLSEDFKAIDSQTSTFQRQCEGLLSAQKRDTDFVADIEHNIQFYEFLDPASRRLNAPGAGNIVRGQDFSDMLRRLDECLDYMETHPEQKEADVYRSRYRLLLTRALTLIRGHFVSSLRDVYSSVAKKITDGKLNDAALSALLYAKFRVSAPELKQIGLEIQKRAVPPLDPDQGTEAEYQSLLNELHTNYATTRGKLITPLVHKRLGEIAQAPSTSKDLFAFARASISYVRGVCLDEFDLWGEWFHGQGGLYDFLETICEPLYDHLRPRIIHEDKIVKLCQLCTLLQTRYLFDQEEETEHLDANQLDFSALIQPALEDVQTRLVFRAQAFLRDEIERFKPRPEDLDYPARNKQLSISASDKQISGRKVSHGDAFINHSKSTKTAGDATDAVEQDSKWDFESQNAPPAWYQTLRKAVWLLSRIYRLVNSTVFDDLAHQIVHQTIASLHYASSSISSKSNTDGQLFLMSHLLLLKQQIVAFDIEYVAPEVSFDFSGVTSTFWELRERGGLFNPRNLMKLVGHGLLPRVVENMLDAKVELDGRLRTVINDFINVIATRMTTSLPSKFVDKRNLQRGELIYPTCRNIENEVPNLREILGEYLDDMRMKETLVGAVQDRVIQIYEEFFDKYTSSGRSRGKPISKKSKGRGDAVWDVDTFAEWCEGIFRVGVAIQGDDDDEVMSQSVSSA
ncbi:Sec34-like family-domain-containing protein [Aspergillus carlsbadensis]|nr:Sec34-like family-domain-containing protein [Aspergillus carlsbadensis]